MNKNVKKNIKKEKTAAAFTNFFLPKNKEIPKDEPDSFDRLDCTTFIVKEENMRLATVLKMETDDSASASSRQLVTQKAGEDEYDDVFAVDDSMNLSIDVDLYQNDGRFSKTESSAPVTAAFKLNAEKKPSKLKALLHSYRDEILENRSRQRRLLKKNTASRICKMITNTKCLKNSTNETYLQEMMDTDYDLTSLKEFLKDQISTSSLNRLCSTESLKSAINKEQQTCTARIASLEKKNDPADAWLLERAKQSKNILQWMFDDVVRTDREILKLTNAN